MLTTPPTPSYQRHVANRYRANQHTTPTLAQRCGVNRSTIRDQAAKYRNNGWIYIHRIPTHNTRNHLTWATVPTTLPSHELKRLLGPAVQPDPFERQHVAQARANDETALEDLLRAESYRLSTRRPISLRLP